MGLSKLVSNMDVNNDAWSMVMYKGNHLQLQSYMGSIVCVRQLSMETLVYDASIAGREDHSKVLECH